MRDAGESGEVFASKSNAEFETASDHCEYISFLSVKKGRDMHDEIRPETGERWL